MNIFNRVKYLDISGNEFEGQKQANLELQRTSAKVVQISDFTIGMFIFNVDTCSVVLHVS